VDDGALGVLESALGGAGFSCHRMTFSEPDAADVDNLFARFGDGSPHLCFAGHVDVVPPGDEAAWRHDPFSAAIEDGNLYGRGAVDMKGGVAAFAAAALDYLRTGRHGFSGAISFLITGDEEGAAINGTKKLLEWVAEHDRVPDHCLLGEPTNPQALGDTIKIGRRGSMNGTLTVTGIQGHVAYPDRADNPLPRLIAMLQRLTGDSFDDGSDNFQPTNLEISSIDVGNPADNVIPARGVARFNLRFGDHYSSRSLMAEIDRRCRAVADEMGGTYELDYYVSGEWFLAQQDGFTDLVATAVEAETGRRPELSTSGGTSDGRFITNYCPVIEFGLVGQTMHKVDEHVALDDLNRLKRIYLNVIEAYFAS
jgi:succinyl-diaminopimelate desuccinylase